MFYDFVPRADQEKTGYSQGFTQNLGLFEKAFWGMLWGGTMAHPSVGLGLQGNCTGTPTAALSFLRMSPIWGLNGMKHLNEIKVFRDSYTRPND